MGAALGLAVALSRTRAPGGGASEGLVDDLLGWWRPDAVAVVAVLLVLAAYLRGVRAAHVSRIESAVVRSWPLWRTVTAAAGAALALVALGAPARPRSAMVLTVGIAQYVVIAVVVPILVALAAPGALARVVRPPAPGAGVPRRWARVVGDPVNAFAILVAVTAAVWATPLGEAAMGNAPLHLLVMVSLLSAGTVLARSVLDTDPLAGLRPARDRAIVVLATGGFLIGFSAALYAREPLPGTTAAGLGVVSAAQVVIDQHRAAALLLAVAIALVLAAAVALVLHRRSDSTAVAAGAGRVPAPSRG